MKMDSKMRRIQQKYRDEIESKNKKQKDVLEAVSVIFFIIFLLYFGVKFTLIESDGIQPIPADDIEKRWMEVTLKIDDTLKNVSVEYTGIAIDFDPEPIKIILKTSIVKENIHGDDNLNELISVANEKIKSDNLPALLKENESYEIIVRGKNKEEITRKMFRQISE